MNVKLILLTLFGSALAAPLTQEDKNFLYSVLKDVPKEDRSQFLFQQMYLGYVKSNPSGFEVDNATSVKIYDIFMKKAGVKLKTPICFPDGRCVDPDDSGIYPLLSSEETEV